MTTDDTDSTDFTDEYEEAAGPAAFRSLVSGSLPSGLEFAQSVESVSSVVNRPDPRVDFLIENESLTAVGFGPAEPRAKSQKGLFARPKKVRNQEINFLQSVE